MAFETELNERDSGFMWHAFWCQVGLKGQPPILEGELPFDVKPDDSMWNLADGRLLELSLAKQDAMRWWPHVLQGEPQINIQKVRVQAARAWVTSTPPFATLHC
jgi:hypothetical protein